MKAKKLLVVLCAVMMCLSLGLFAACGGVSAESVSLNKSTLGLKIGETGTIVADVEQHRLGQVVSHQRRRSDFHRRRRRYRHGHGKSRRQRYGDSHGGRKNRLVRCCGFRGHQYYAERRVGKNFVG